MFACLMEPLQEQLSQVAPQQVPETTTHLLFLFNKRWIVSLRKNTLWYIIHINCRCLWSFGVARWWIWLHGKRCSQGTLLLYILLSILWFISNDTCSLSFVAIDKLSWYIIYVFFFVTSEYRLWRTWMLSSDQHWLARFVLFLSFILSCYHIILNYITINGRIVQHTSWFWQDPTEQTQIDNYMVQKLDGTSNEWGWCKQKVPFFSLISSCSSLLRIIYCCDILAN